MKSSIESLSQPISEDMPSGENPEYDPQFLEMVELYEAKEKSGASVSDDPQADGGPDWKGVENRAQGLLETSRDLRVLVYAAIASIHTKGVMEFQQHLELLKIYLQDFWDSVHPQLDPEDDNDPMLRLNTLDLFNDRSRVGMGLEHVKLVEQRGLGQFGVREVEISQGRETPAKDEEVSDINLIRQVFASSEPEHLDDLHNAVKGSLALLKEIDAVWMEKTGDPAGPGFEVANEGLKKMAHVLDEFAPAPSDSGQAEDGSPAAAAGGEVAAPLSGTVNSRADVIRALDRICEYYVGNEPSSPVPILLRRAQRLVEKSFMEILEDMAPDGVQQAKLVSGNVDEN
jgi:type VI secretion system protein ImpA